MSYILDALKKLEHEKSRKSRRDGMISISGSLFENERQRPSGPAGWKIALAVTVAVLLTFGATWLFLRPGKDRVTLLPRLAVPVSPAPPASTLPAVPTVTAETAPVTPVPAVVPVQQIQTAVPPVPVKSAPIRPPAPPSKPERKTVQAGTAGVDADEYPVQKRPPRTIERKVQALSADLSMPAPADIKLSGIAWQEERRARRAVVNGFLMQEGGVVSGARITDIYQDRVRFSLSGKIFEIPLISSTVPAAGK